MTGYPFTFVTSANESAEEVKQWLAAIIESPNDAIISKNLESIVTSWNKGAERLFGYRAEEMVGAPITVLFPKTGRTRSSGFSNHPPR